MLRSDYPTLRLAVEEDFDGSRGYGYLDYVIFLGFLAILVTEAKWDDIEKGVTQNLVQLHTAAEVIKNIAIFILTSFYCYNYFYLSLQIVSPYFPETWQAQARGRAEYKCLRDSDNRIILAIH